jgi:hypothetical protein
MEQIECSETSAYKIQTPGNHPEENIQHTEMLILTYVDDDYDDDDDYNNNNNNNYNY